MNAPLPVGELRSRVREIADACIVDSMISYVAALREECLISPDAGEIIVDEWSSAQHEAGVMTRESLELIRAGHVPPIVGELDAFVEQAIEERRSALRSAAEDSSGDDDSPGVAEDG